MYLVNKLGRNNQRRKPLPIEIRNQVLEKAAYTSYTGLLPLLGIQPTTISNIVKLHRDSGSVNCREQNYTRTLSKLTFEDSILLETIVTEQVSTSLLEIQKELIQHGDCENISTSTI